MLEFRADIFCAQHLAIEIFFDPGLAVCLSDATKGCFQFLDHETWWREVGLFGIFKGPGRECIKICGVGGATVGAEGCSQDGQGRGAGGGPDDFAGAG